MEEAERPGGRGGGTNVVMLMSAQMQFMLKISRAARWEEETHLQHQLVAALPLRACQLPTWPGGARRERHSAQPV